ncbi:MAG: hypothetical protein V8R72_00315 [Clostridia bacterium]
MSNEIEDMYNNKLSERYERKLKITKMANILKVWVNPNITAKDVNLKLEELGFQYKNEKRRVDYQ